MNLGQVLHFADLNRNSFNTLERRTGLGFMKLGIADERSRDRYSFVHVVALGCMLEFMAVGVPGARASKAVEKLFPAIGSIVDGIIDGKDQADGGWLSILGMDQGAEFPVRGLQQSGDFGGHRVHSVVSINAAVVWAAIASRFTKPIHPTNRAGFAQSMAGAS